MLKTDSRKQNLIIFACFGIYFMSVAVKSLFAAEIVSIIDFFGTTKAEASIANTCYYVTYGVVQFLLSVIFQKIKVKRFLYISVPCSAILCILIAFAKDIRVLWIIFALNGIAQSGIWAGSIELIGDYVSEEKMPWANKFMNMGFAVGNTFAYGVSAICVAVNRWELAFIINGVVFFVFIFVFIFVINKYGKEKILNEKKETVMKNGFVHLETKKEKFVFFDLTRIVSFLSAAAYYAIMNWMVDFLNRVFSINESISIIITIFLPIIMIISPIMAVNINRREKNFIKEMFYLSVFPMVASIGLIFIYDVNIILSLVILVILIVDIRAINVVIASMIGLNMRSEINSGGYCAQINAIGCIAAGVVPTVIGYFIDNFGWRSQFIIESIIIALLLLVLFISYKLYKKKIKMYT